MYKLSCLLILFCFYSCNSPKKDSCVLIASSDSLIFELNPQTSMFIKALFPYIDESGREYLTFQNNIEPEILWYDMNSQNYIKTVKLDKEGANGISNFVGYYIHSNNEIYIPEGMRNMINIVDGEGKILRKILYENTTQGKSAIPFNCLSFPYTPIYVIDGKMYLPQSPNMGLGERIVEDSPVTLVLDTVRHSLDEFDLRFPKIVSSTALKGNSLGIEMGYSQIYNGKDFIYSFFFDEDVYVVSQNGINKGKISVKSKYIDEISSAKKIPGDISELVRTLCSIPMYGNLIYDKYREVYYRFAYPETKLRDENCMDIWQLGRTKFSIIILDKNLETVGETLFPENTYASTLFFIRKDGLYLSTSFVKNPNYNDDELCFKRFDLLWK
ncbi:protein of unknown function [Bacteroides sp. AR20]|uniref:DUF4221 family protein n=1 Tax=Bacteroides sp. AR20 TaxID=93974 RepID=UPI0008C6FBBE|nr:DUF4221 family protein [Bacteroides sp. AR20]SEN91301.1 protein of unknown function [Bacteroides sp. AR20]